MVTTGAEHDVTITITMDVRLCEYMKEWLPDEMEKEPPPTPYHPDLMSLNMEEELLSADDEGKKAHRQCAQLLYCVTTVYLNAQWCLYFIARYTSHPTKLYQQCLLHALRHLFGYTATIHCSLVTRCGTHLLPWIEGARITRCGTPIHCV